jgi:hypothetical protein
LGRDVKVVDAGALLVVDGVVAVGVKVVARLVGIGIRARVGGSGMV